MLPINNKEYKIDLTAAAFAQIQLILENDYTIEGQLFRLKIDGKGCEGFDYATGFSEKLGDDIELEFEHNKKKIKIILDQFTAHYCSEGHLDYIFDTAGQEGFVFQNTNEHKYHGKFFKDESMLPPKELGHE